MAMLDMRNHEIREAISGNLRRCAGYHKIIKATAPAAADLRSKRETL